MSEEWGAILKPDLRTVHEKRVIINKVIPACETPREKLLIKLLWYTGKRPSEIRLLKAEHVDVKKGLIFWSISKKRKKYTIWKRAHPDLIKELKDYIYYKGLNEEDFLFPTNKVHKLLPDDVIEHYKRVISEDVERFKGDSDRITLTQIRREFNLTYKESKVVYYCYHNNTQNVKHESLSVRQIENIIKKVGERCELKLTPTGFRHSINTYLSSKGVKAKARMKFNDHSSEMISLIYDDLTSKDMDKIFKVM